MLVLLNASYSHAKHLVVLVSLCTFVSCATTHHYCSMLLHCVPPHTTTALCSCILCHHTPLLLYALALCATTHHYCSMLLHCVLPHTTTALCSCIVCHHTPLLLYALALCATTHHYSSMLLHFVPPHTTTALCTCIVCYHTPLLLYALALCSTTHHYCSILLHCVPPHTTTALCSCIVCYHRAQPHLSIRTSESPGRDEGWEYARKPHLSYHPEPGKMCMARRRRWLRKLEPSSKQAEVSEKRPTFQFVSKVCGKCSTGICQCELTLCSP